MYGIIMKSGGGGVKKSILSMKQQGHQRKSKGTENQSWQRIWQSIMAAKSKKKKKKNSVKKRRRRNSERRNEKRSEKKKSGKQRQAEIRNENK